MLYRVVGKSMEPAYKNGSVLLISKAALRFGLKIGDAVMAFDPRDKRPILKRIAKVSKEGIYLKGDNEAQSTDSRTFGIVTKENIIGKVIMKFPNKISKLAHKAVLVLASIGLLDSGYLTFKHITGGEVTCSAIPGANCDVVLGSMYSTIFGIPLALLGTLYYLTVLTLWIIYLQKGDSRLLQFIFGITGVGFLTSLYLIYIQAFVLYAYCAFCMLSALTSTLLFVSLLLLVLSQKRTGDSTPDDHS